MVVREEDIWLERLPGLLSSVPLSSPGADGLRSPEPQWTNRRFPVGNSSEGEDSFTIFVLQFRTTNSSESGVYQDGVIVFGPSKEISETHDNDIKDSEADKCTLSD